MDHDMRMEWVDNLLEFSQNNNTNHDKQFCISDESCNVETSTFSSSL